MPLTLMQNVTTLWSWRWYHLRLYMPLASLQNITRECRQRVAL